MQLHGAILGQEQLQCFVVQAVVAMLQRLIQGRLQLIVRRGRRSQVDDLDGEDILTVLIHAPQQCFAVFDEGDRTTVNGYKRSRQLAALREADKAQAASSLPGTIGTVTGQGTEQAQQTALRCIQAGGHLPQARHIAIRIAVRINLAVGQPLVAFGFVHIDLQGGQFFCRSLGPDSQRRTIVVEAEDRGFAVGQSDLRRIADAVTISIHTRYRVLQLQHTALGQQQIKRFVESRLIAVFQSFKQGGLQLQHTVDLNNLDAEHHIIVGIHALQLGTTHGLQGNSPAIGGSQTGEHTTAGYTDKTHHTASAARAVRAIATTGGKQGHQATTDAGRRLSQSTRWAGDIVIAVAVRAFTVGITISVTGGFIQATGQATQISLTGHTDIQGRRVVAQHQQATQIQGGTGRITVAILDTGHQLNQASANSDGLIAIQGIGMAHRTQLIPGHIAAFIDREPECHQCGITTHPALKHAAIEVQLDA